MHIFVTRILGVGALAVGVALPAQAQFQPAPGLNQGAFNAGAAGAAPAGPVGGARPANGGFFNPANLGQFGAMTTTQAAPAYSGPYGGGGGYGGYPPFPFFGYGTYIPPNMGNLYGSATVINSLGQYMTTTQQARLMQEQVRREKLETRRRVIEQWLWERNNLPTTEDDRDRARQFALRRSQVEPPTTEIFSGQSLNTLLGDIQRLQGQGIKAPQDPSLPDNIMGQINFIPKGKGAANAGVLKNYKTENKLDWPIELRLEDYRGPRDLIESLTREAIQQASTVGRVDAGTLQALDREINRMSDILRANLNQKDLSPRVYNPAKNFLTDLTNGLQALSDPDAKKFFTDQYTPSGKTVSDLAADMQKKGLEFGPATATQQPAYSALQQFMAAYDMLLNSNASLQGERR